MNALVDTCRMLVRKTLILLVIGLGLISIVGTGSDDDDNGPRSNTAPTPRIESPGDEAVYQVDHTVTFTGSATDAEDRVLAGSSLSWDSSIDGHIGTGTHFTTGALSQGTHQITLTAMDSQGWAGSTSVSITMNPQSNTLPTAVISYPTTGSTYNLGDFIDFTGSGYDAEDGLLSGLSLVWHSSKDGQVGTGNTVTTHSLTSGSHTITLRATDSAGTSDTASVAVTIINTPPVAAIHYPADGSTFSVGQSIPFSGSGTDDEDGNLTGRSLIWYAGSYDVIGEGGSPTVRFFQAGTIIINLRAVDAGNLEDIDTITITIEP
ncbi:hypothetical protein JCM14469_10600 [Desulfatiferula olefinivorans]